jgi:hypothetical protein
MLFEVNAIKTIRSLRERPAHFSFFYAYFLVQ